jgi:hypothetical protein
MHRHPSGNLLGCEPLPTQLCDLLIAILSLGSLPGNGLLDVLSWRRTPLGNRKRRFHLLSRLTCLLILCLLQFRKNTCEQELDCLCQILPDMIAVCDLDRLRGACFGCGSIVFAAIAADMGGFRMPFHPSRCGVLLTVRQEVKDLMPLQIHQYRAKGSAPAKRESSTPKCSTLSVVSVASFMTRRKMLVREVSIRKRALSRAPNRPHEAKPMASIC